MSNAKKRGRPSNAELAARGQPGGDVTHNGDEHYFPEPTAPVAPDDAADAAERAQAYAMRVWSGQSVDLKRADRVARCRSAVEAQGLPTDALQFPGSEDDVWTEEDELPLSWRMALPEPKGIV